MSRPWGRLAVYEGGRGAPLLAVHGLGGSGRYFAELARLAGRSQRVIAPDLAGFGHSDKPVGIDYSLDFHIANLDAALTHCGVEGPLTVVGHSLGGALGALWAARQPHRVAALALVSAPYPGGRGGAEAERGERERSAGGTGRAIYGLVTKAWPILTLPYFSRRFPRVVVADYLRHTLESYWETAGSVLWQRDRTEELRPLAAREGRATLLLWARDDARVCLSETQRWSAALPGAELRIVESGGHQVLLRTHFAPLLEWLQERRLVAA